MRAALGALTALSVALLLLCGCSTMTTAAGPDPTEVPEPSPTVPTMQEAIPTPVPIATPRSIPELVFPDGSVHKSLERRLKLPEITHEEVDAYLDVFQEMPKLRYVDLGEEGNASMPRDFGLEDVGRFQEMFPEVEFEFGFTLFEKHFTTLDREMNFHHVSMDDEGAAVRRVLPYMTRCRRLDMDFSGVSSKSMAEIRDDYPQMDVIWRIWFGSNCSVRTDVERILASNLDHKLTDDNTTDLKYCTKVRFLDIGHNSMLTDFSFLAYMPDLEVAILGISGLQDLTPLSGCSKLEYLEINTLYWGQDLDLLPLKDLKNLEHLNICRLGHVRHWEVLKDLTKLKRLYFGCYTWVPEGAKEELEQALPNTEIDWKTPTGCDDGWRFDGSGGYVERYQLLREQFEYSNYTNVSSAWYNDPLYYKEGEPRYRPSDWW